MRTDKGGIIMKKFMKQFLCMAVALCLITCFMPQRADASTTKYVTKINTLAQNTYVTSKGYNSVYSTSTSSYTKTSYFYKITVPAGGYVTFHTNSTSKSIYLYRTIKKNKSYFDSNNINYLYNKKTYYRVLPSGVYYVFAEKGLKFKWVFHKTTTPTNYCRSKAYGLSASKKTTTVFPRGYEFNRWYKITVTSKKTLYLYLTDLTTGYTLSVDVLTAGGIKVYTTSVNDTTYRTKEAVTKGTYYLRVSPHDYTSTTDYYKGRIGTLMWK